MRVSLDQVETMKRVVGDTDMSRAIQDGGPEFEFDGGLDGSVAVTLRRGGTDRNVTLAVIDRDGKITAGEYA